MGCIREIPSDVYKRQVETLVARRIIAADVAPGTTMLVDAKDGQLVVE